MASAPRCGSKILQPQNINKNMGSLVTILPDNIMYTKVRAADVQEIVEETIVRKRIVERQLYKHPVTHASCRGTWIFRWISIRCTPCMRWWGQAFSS
jgi:(2Fe-2S) ferredoxin